MTNFVRDNITIAGPKVQWDETSTEVQRPDMFLSAADYNTVRQAANDIRAWILTGLSPGTITNATVIVDSDGRITGLASGAGGIADGTVTNVKLADMPANTIKLNNTASPAVPIDGSVAQLLAMLGLATIATSASGADLSAASVTNAKLAVMAANTVKLNNTGGSAVPIDGSVAQLLVMLGLATIATSGSGGDLSAASVTNAKLAVMAANTIKLNNTGGSAVPIDGSVAQLLTMLGLATIATSGSGGDLSSASVTNAKLAVMAANTIKLNNTGSPATPIDGTISQLAALLAGFFSSAIIDAGDGSDGALSPTGASTTTLTKDTFWTTLTVPSGGCIIKTKGNVVYVRVIDVSSGGSVVFHHDGDAASGATGATGMNSEGSLQVFSGSGATGIGNAGQPGAAATNQSWPTSFRAGLGGAGAAGGGGASGAGGPAPGLYTDSVGSINDRARFITAHPNYSTSSRCAGGSGGGSAAGSGSPNFFGGGGGGAGGGYCAVVIGSIIGSPALITVRANGGAGAAGPSGNVGGGGGGGYAGVVLCSGNPATIVVQADGGSPSGGGTAPPGKTLRFGG